MHRVKDNPLPKSDSPEELANDFNEYFNTNIENIRSNFDNNIENAFEYEAQLADISSFSHFSPLSEETVRKIILKQTNKTSELDAIPTHLLNSCINETATSHKSTYKPFPYYRLFPKSLQNSNNKTFNKNPNLDKVLRNYRPVSNLSSISKLIEEAVCQQISDHIATNNLVNINQSAYKRNHSTETALLKVSNDILTELDNRNIVFFIFFGPVRSFPTHWTIRLCCTVLADYSGLWIFGIIHTQFFRTE